MFKFSSNIRKYILKLESNINIINGHNILLTNYLNGAKILFYLNINKISLNLIKYGFY